MFNGQNKVKDKKKRIFQDINQFFFLNTNKRKKGMKNYFSRTFDM